MMDDKMKDRFCDLCDQLNMDDRQKLAARKAVEWTIDYLRSQQEPVGEVVSFRNEHLGGTWGQTQKAALVRWSGIPKIGDKLYAHPTPSAPVPDKIDDRYQIGSSEEYAYGWNDCIDSMLAAAPSPTEKKES